MGKPKKYEERLMDALAFDEDDLDANAAGHFSEAQREDFAAEQRRLALFIAGDTLIVAAWLILTRFGGFIGATLPLVLIVLPILLALVLSYAIRLYRLYADVREDQPQNAEGRVELSMHGKSGAGSTVDCTIRVSDAKFPLKEEAFLAFKNGDPYRIYYASRSKKLLSVEWLRENDDSLLPVTDFVTNGEADEDADAKVSHRYS